MGYNEEETALGDGGETDGLVNILVRGMAQGIALRIPPWKPKICRCSSPLCNEALDSQ